MSDVMLRNKLRETLPAGIAAAEAEKLAGPAPSAAAKAAAAKSAEEALAAKAAEAVDKGKDTAIKRATSTGYLGMPLGQKGELAYSALNELLMGLPDFLVKKVGGSERFKEFQKWRETQNREFKEVNPDKFKPGDVGSALGFAGSLAIPSGAIVKGLGAVPKGAAAIAKAAKATDLAADLSRVGAGADKLSDIMRGARAVKGVLPTIGKAALVSAEQAVPRGIFHEDKPADILKNIGIGTAVGTAASVLPKLAPMIADKTKDVLTGTGLAGAGITTRGFRSGAAKGAGWRSLDKSKSELLDLIRSKGLWTEFAQKQFLDDTSGPWKAMDKAWDTAQDALSKQAPAMEGATTINRKLVSELAPEIAKDAKVAALLAEQGEKGQQSFYKIIGGAAAKKNLADTRKYLSKISDMRALSNTADREFAELADAVYDKVDDIAANLTPELNMPEMKTMWRVTRPLAKSLDRSEATVEGLASSNSATAARQLMAKQLLPMLGVGAAGGAMTGAGGYDPDDPQASIGKIAGNALKGAAFAAVPVVAGSVLNKLAPAAANKLGGISAAYLEKLVPSGDKAARIGQGIANLTTKAAAGARDRPATMFPGDGPLASVRTAPVVAQAEAEAPAQAKAEAKQAVNERWNAAIDKALSTSWKEQGKAAGYSFEQWKSMAMDAAAGKDGNIDPLKAAKILFLGDEAKQEKYLRDYQKYLTLKTIDLQKALAVADKEPGLLSKAFGAGKDKQIDTAKSKLEFQRLRNLMEGLAAGDNQVSTTIQKGVVEDLNAIMQATADPEERAALARQLLQDTYGLDLGTLRELGLE